MNRYVARVLVGLADGLTVGATEMFAFMGMSMYCSVSREIDPLIIELAATGFAVVVVGGEDI
jgi:hypothetical protein